MRISKLAPTMSHFCLKNNLNCCLIDLTQEKLYLEHGSLVLSQQDGSSGDWLHHPGHGRQDLRVQDPVVGLGPAPLAKRLEQEPENLKRLINTRPSEI